MLAVQCPRCIRTMAEIIEGGTIVIKGRGGRVWKLSPKSTFDSVYCADCRLWFVPVVVNMESVGVEIECKKLT